MIENLEWLKIIDRIANELSEEDLGLHVSISMPSGAKLAGKLTDDEAKIAGVIHRMRQQIRTEVEAHNALSYEGEPTKEACVAFRDFYFLKNTEADLANAILCLSVSKRLDIKLDRVAIKDHDIFALPESELEPLSKEMPLDLVADPLFDLVIGDPKKMN